MNKIKTLGGRIRYEIHPDEICEAVAALLKGKYGVDVDPDRITEFKGGKVDKYLIAHALVVVEARS